MMKLKAILFLLAGIGAVFAGAPEAMKADIAFLSSEACRGRGFTHKGISEAEKYITGELSAAGLTVRTRAVPLKVNVALRAPVCTLNGDTLQPGYDYIPHPYCPSVKTVFDGGSIGIYDPARLDSLKEMFGLNSLSEVRRHLMTVRPRKSAEKLLVFPEEYILQSRQNKQSSLPAIQVRQNLIPDTVRTLYLSHRVRYKRFSSNNIIAVIEGGSEPDSVIMLTAHYDHMGALGDEVYYPGANDNASGVAVLLSLARYYAQNSPKHTLVFVFFTGEEQGLAGSWNYVRRPAVPLKNIAACVNLDMVGSGREGYGMVAGADCPKDTLLLQEIAARNGLGEIRVRDNSPNSDHFPFTVYDVNAFFLYASGGEQPYHHPEDIAETLDWDVLENTYVLIRDYLDRR